MSALLEVICLIGVHWLFFLAAGTVGFTRGVHMGFMCLKVPDCSPVFI